MKLLPVKGYQRSVAGSSVKYSAWPTVATLGEANPPVPPPVAVDQVEPASAINFIVQSVPAPPHPVGGVITVMIALPLTWVTGDVGAMVVAAVIALPIAWRRWPAVVRVRLPSVV